MLITKRQLKERGWTEKMLKKFNIQPDIVRVNPVYKSAAPMQLYSIHKIANIESTEHFIEYKRKNAKVFAGAKGAVETKRNKAEFDLNNLTINVEFKEDVYKAAIDNYNAWESFKETHRINYEGRYIQGDKINIGFLKRITCNYIRHELINYDGMLERYVQKKVGTYQLYYKLKSKIKEKIKEVYPFLDC